MMYTKSITSPQQVQKIKKKVLQHTVQQIHNKSKQVEVGLKEL